ncbi:hypothetical protein [Sphaerotilus sp.]|nr:hypothetical protein [Sphaerotilus sp.]MDZ7857241.1 hypothetical protein [Sphaerotilus sp.]
MRHFSRRWIWRVDVVDGATLSEAFRERLFAEHLLLQGPSAH